MVGSRLHSLANALAAALPVARIKATRLLRFAADVYPITHGFLPLVPCCPLPRQQIWVTMRGRLDTGLRLRIGAPQFCYLTPWLHIAVTWIGYYAVAPLLVVPFGWHTVGSLFSASPCARFPSCFWLLCSSLADVVTLVA